MLRQVEIVLYRESVCTSGTSASVTVETALQTCTDENIEKIRQLLTEDR